MSDSELNEQEVLEAVRRSFSKIYTGGNNDAETEKLIQSIGIQKGGRYLDLGTGSGYVAFMMSRANPEAYFDGLDVVESVISRNNAIVLQEGRERLKFYSYDGKKFPMDDLVYDGLIARYTLHHFPNIENTVKEINRVLKEKSRIVISDCIRNEKDKARFLDLFMKRLGDGHVSFIDEKDFCELFGRHGFKLKYKYETEVGISRSMDAGYRELINSYSEEARSYRYIIDEDEVRLTVRVNNLVFERGGSMPCNPLS